MMGEDKLP